MAGSNINRLHIPLGTESFQNNRQWFFLEEVCTGVFDCPHSTPNLTEDGPLLARSQDIRTGVFLAYQAAHVSPQTYEERISRAEPSHGDILYSREGTYFGIAAEVPEGQQVCLGQRMVLIRPNHQRLNFRYLRFWLNSKTMAAHIHGFRDGTVAERLNMSTIRALPIPVPPMSEQQAIANILGAFDDKIELNRKMNETLEAMARAVFKSWFVDFDGVTEFDDSELGPIPKWWKVAPYSDTIVITGGGTPKTSIAEYWNGNIPWFSVVDAPALSDVFVVDTVKHISPAGLENSSTRLLDEGTTIITARGTVGKIALLAQPMTMNQSCYGIQGREGYPKFYNYYSLRRLIDSLKTRAHGSVFDTITRDTFKSVPAVCPPPQKAQEFDELTLPFMSKILNNLHESQTLAELRDTLLPKLMSGEIRVKDSEKVAEEAL